MRIVTYIFLVTSLRNERNVQAAYDNAMDFVKAFGANQVNSGGTTTESKKFTESFSKDTGTIYNWVIKTILFR